MSELNFTKSIGSVKHNSVGWERIETLVTELTKAQNCGDNEQASAVKEELLALVPPLLRPSLLRFCAGNGADVDDILSQVSLKLLKLFEERKLILRSQGHCAGYFSAMARSTALDYLRREPKWITGDEAASVILKMPFVASSETTDPELDLRYRKLRRVIAQAVALCDSTTREILQLGSQGLRPKEIASKMGIPTHVVYRKIRKTRRILLPKLFASRLIKLSAPTLCARVKSLYHLPLQSLELEGQIHGAESRRKRSVVGRLEKLSPRLRSVAILIGGGRSESEIATELKIPIGTVRSRRAAIAAKMRIDDFKGCFDEQDVKALTACRDAGPQPIEKPCLPN